MNKNYLIKRLKLIQQFYNDEFLVNRIVTRLINEVEQNQIVFKKR